MIELTDRVVLVTGAGGGIGSATARTLAGAGAMVVIHDVTAASLAPLADELGERAHALPVDLRDRHATQRLWRDALAIRGRIDVLVNNAGVTRDNLLFKMTEDEWDSCVDVSLKGAFLMCQAAQKHMVPAGYGKIVNLSSASALGNRGQANYSAAKAGIQGLTATLALELGRYNINVNAVAPGFVATAMTVATAERMGVAFEDMVKYAEEQIPLRRVAQPEDIASVIAFLASEDARHVSGQTLYVNGGLR
jgi:3-oxoacyl-[acyl-carrier protein] reductase